MIYKLQNLLNSYGEQINEDHSKLKDTFQKEKVVTLNSFNHQSCSKATKMLGDICDFVKKMRLLTERTVIVVEDST